MAAFLAPVVFAACLIAGSWASDSIVVVIGVMAACICLNVAGVSVGTLWFADGRHRERAGKLALLSNATAIMIELGILVLMLH